MLLFGVVPIERRSLQFEVLEDGRFVDCSTGWLNGLWRHDRSVAARDDGSTLLTDKLVLGPAPTDHEDPGAARSHLDVRTPPSSPPPPLPGQSLERQGRVRQDLPSPQQRQNGWHHRVEVHPVRARRRPRPGWLSWRRRTERQHGWLGHVDVVDGQVDVKLLRSLICGPGGRDVVVRLLEGEASPGSGSNTTQSGTSPS